MMKRLNIDVEYARLKAENIMLINKNKSLSQKLETSKIKKAKLQRELKKKTHRQSY